MEIIVDQAQGSGPVTILRLHGDLDSSNYELVISKVQELYKTGMRRVVLDMSHVPFMGSSGLIALHSAALLLRGEQPPDPEYGWQAFHDLDQDRDVPASAHLKLLKPQPKIIRTLEMTGMAQFFDIYEDEQAAVAAF